MKRYHLHLAGLLIAVIAFAATFTLINAGSARDLRVGAEYEDGEDCWVCGNYHWDQYMCGMCGSCSEEGNEDCWEKAHCPLCETCLQSVAFCDQSGSNICMECLEENGFHCRECDECYCEETDAFEYTCTNCFKCESCGGTICEDCGFCDDCVENEKMHCSECGECFSNVVQCKDNDHCEDCHVICDQCDRDNLEEDIETCEICGLCEDCCLEFAEEDGCTCGEYCVEDSDYYLHFCDACGECFDNVEQCELCDLCLDCCESESECDDGMCVADSDYEEHFCEDCGLCFHVVDQCETCWDYGVLRCRDCCEEVCYYFGCDCFDQCCEDPEFQDHLEFIHSDITATVHNYPVPATQYSYNTTSHWKECRYCDESSHITSRKDHTLDSRGRCTVCSYTKDMALAIVTQPKDATGVVTDLRTETYANSSHKVRFAIDAVGTGTLKYSWQIKKPGTSNWYYAQNTAQNPFYISGQGTRQLVLAVPEDACYETYELRCMVSDGTNSSVISNAVTLIGRHNYQYHIVYASGTNKVTLTNGKTLTWANTQGQILSCTGCLEDKKGASVVPHTFTNSSYAGKQLSGKEWLGHVCKDCGYTGYYEKHDHYFWTSDGTMGTIIEEMTDELGHTIQCLYPGCTYTKMEAHTFGTEIVQVPGGKNTNGAFARDCLDCGYPIDNIYDPQGNIVKWTTSNYLCKVDGGYASKTVFTASDTLKLTEYVSSYFRVVQSAKRENKRVTGWKATEVHGLFDASGNYLGKSSPVDVTSKFKFTNNGDNTWTVKWNGTIAKGSQITFTATTVTCTHNVGTKIVDQKPGVCNLDGYTGDTVCKGCGKLIATGNPIAAPSATHTGTLTLIPGTSITGSCKVRGFEGIYQCSACKQKVAGKKTGYNHSKYSWTLVDKVAADCTHEGYTGDWYCNNCNKLAKHGKVTAPYHANTTLINVKAATKKEPGYSGDTYCNICKQIVVYGHNTPRLKNPVLEEISFTLPIPNPGETGAIAISGILEWTKKPAEGQFYVISSWTKLDANGTYISAAADTFEEGKTYYASFFVFSQSYEINNSTKILINGKEMGKTPETMIGYDGYRVRYAFKPGEGGGLPPVVNKFELMFYEPTAGALITDKADAVCNTPGLAIKEVHWYHNDPDNKEEIVPDGKTKFGQRARYKVRFVLTPTDGYKFPNGSLQINGTINGNSLVASKLYQNPDFFVEYSFMSLVFLNLENLYFTGIPKEMTYTGSPAVLPESVFSTGRVLEVTDGHYESFNVRKGVDYAVSYEDNVLVGTAKAIFTAIGERCQGSKVFTFEIVPRVGWNKDKTGYFYLRADKSQPKGQFEKISGKWYHFDAKGYMQTGWVKDGGKWYYMNSSGAMQTGWIKDGGKWYYLSSSGAMQTGWVQVSGKWYYMNSSGVMQTGWVKVSGKWYYMNSSGVMQTGWVKVSNKWYYFNGSGVMQTGWVTISGKQYYLFSDGHMAASEWVPGYWWIDANGVWTYKYKGSWTKDSKGWWFGDTSGWYAKNTTIKIDGKNYTFDANGYMK